jgi:hypothetical protein
VGFTVAAVGQPSGEGTLAGGSGKEEHMAHKFAVGYAARLPKPFSDIVGHVIAVRGTDAGALITVEYPADGAFGETLVKVFRPSRLAHAAAAVA